jgi:hypothetical protein
MDPSFKRSTKRESVALIGPTYLLLYVVYTPYGRLRTVERELRDIKQHLGNGIGDSSRNPEVAAEPSSAAADPSAIDPLSDPHIAKN